MSMYQLPQLTDVSWRGICDYFKNLSVNAPSPWREHFAANLKVIQPTLTALGIDADQPGPIRVNLKESVVTPWVPPVTQAYVAPPGTPTNTPNPQKTVLSPAIHLFDKEPQVGQLSEGDGLALAVQVATQLEKDFGFTREQAAGIVGNLFHESFGMNANVNEFGWKYPQGDPRNFGAPFTDNPYGYGWAQWSADRKDAYIAFCKAQGLNPASPAANYAFLVHEMKTTEANSVLEVKKTFTVEDSALAFRRFYERAAMPVDAKRKEAGETIFAAMA